VHALGRGGGRLLRLGQRQDGGVGEARSHLPRAGGPTRSDPLGGGPRGPLSPRPRHPPPKTRVSVGLGGAPTKPRSGCYGGSRYGFRFCVRIWFPLFSYSVFDLCSQLFQFCCLDRSSPPSAAPGAKIEPSQSTENKWEHKSNTTSKHNRNINLNTTRTASGTGSHRQNRPRPSILPPLRSSRTGKPKHKISLLPGTY
jgi:hypothetical protein